MPLLKTMGAFSRKTYFLFWNKILLKIRDHNVICLGEFDWEVVTLWVMRASGTASEIFNHVRVMIKSVPVPFPVVNISKQIRKFFMEAQTETKNKVYFHYNHTDSCKFARWNAR